MPRPEAHIVKSQFPSVPLPPGSYIDFLYSKVDEDRAQRPAIVDYKSGRQITFGELKRLVGCVASALHKRGFGRGHVLSLFGPNRLENAPIAHGVIAAGGTIHLIKPNASCEELQYHLELAKPRFVVTTLNMASKVQEAVGKATDAHVEDVYVIGGAETKDYRRAEELLEDAGDANPWGRIEIDPKNDVAALMLTGGTTGMSKTVMITHDGMKKAIRRLEDVIQDMAEDAMSLGYIPFSHIYSFLGHHGVWLHSGSAVLTMEGFDGPTALRAIEKHRVTNVGLTPVSALNLTDTPGFEEADLSSIRLLMWGGAALAKESEEMVIRKFRSKAPNADIFQAYGMTELSAAVTSTLKNRPPEKIGSVGVAMQDTEIKVVSCDGKGRMCGPNEPGEIVIRSPTITKGYLGNEEATRKAIRDGWYYSGDFGWYDEDEYFYVIDRIDDLIHHKDGLVIPTHVEAILRGHPAVSDCAIVGKEDKLNGAVAVAFVVKQGEVTAADLQQFMAERVEPFERLEGGVKFVESIPKSPAGKMLRRALVCDL